MTCPGGSGRFEPSEDAVFGSVARFTRVCTYDRPDIRFEGTDITTPRPQPHTVDLDVGDLHALLTALGEPAPYVLVAHSYGGLIATLFARTYPETVGGLVMVDTVTPLMEDVTSAERLVNWDATNATTSPQVREGVKLIDAFEKINAAPPLPELPAVVLSADKPWRTDLLPAAATRRRPSRSPNGWPRWTSWRRISAPSTSPTPTAGTTSTSTTRRWSPTRSGTSSMTSAGRPRHPRADPHPHRTRVSPVTGPTT